MALSCNFSISKEIRDALDFPGAMISVFDAENLSAVLPSATSGLTFRRFAFEVGHSVPQLIDLRNTLSLPLGVCGEDAIR